MTTSLLVTLCVLIALILIGAVIGKPVGWVAIGLAVLGLLATLTPALVR